MIKKYFNLVCLCYLLLLAGCSKSPFSTGTISIRLEIPEELTDFSPNNIPITLINQNTGTTYTALTDSHGEVTLEVAVGSCRISVNTTLTRGNMDYILSAGLADLYFGGEGEVLPLTLPVQIIPKGRLVIEELYFSGCRRPDGKTNYTLDQYITIANNSHDIYYLDGLCIAQAGPPTTFLPSGWMLNTEMKEIPLFMMCWQFPGSGTDYPLLPGERQVIATQAIDHTAGEAGVPASLNLSNVEWAFWDSKLTGSKITAGVKPMHLVWRGSGSSYALTVSGPTVVLFRPETNMVAWASDVSHLRPEPGKPSKLLYLHIPSAWILDAPNFVSSIGMVVNSRLPIMMDASPGIAGPTGSGLAKYRKKLMIPGNKGWWDSNNTLVDFGEGEPSLKRHK